MSQDGVIRSSSFTPDAPAESTFTNRGGVLRAQVGSASDAQALQRDAAAQKQVDEAQPKWGSTARSNGGLVRTTISDGVATETSIPDVVAGTSGDSEAASGKYGVIASARSSGGRPLTGTEITRSSLVTVDGVTTSVAAAVAMGLIRVDGRTGLYVDMNSTGPAVAPQTPAEERAAQLVKDQAELQRIVDAKREAEEKANTTEVPVAEPFDATTEALLSETIKGLGNQSAQAAVHSIINTGELSAGLTASIAGQLGIEGPQAAERAQVLMGAFKSQADAAVGVDSAEAIWDWARDNRAAALKDAMVRHANEGTTGRYADIAQDYFASLADTQEGRDLIMASNDATARGISVDQRTGKVFITAPKVGKVEWRNAVKLGMIQPNHNRRT
jgi:hypothetical protein